MLRTHSESTPARAVDRPAARADRGFPEAKTYLWLVIGFLICHYLFTTWLRWFGLDAFADRFEPRYNASAPYLLFPVVLVLVIQTARRHLLPAVVIVAGTLVLHYFFYIHFVERWAWGGLVLIGAGVALSYFLYRAGRMVEPPAPGEFRRLLLVCSLTYLAGIPLALGLRELIERADFAGRAGRELPASVSILPGLLALAAFMIERRLRGGGAGTGTL